MNTSTAPFGALGPGLGPAGTYGASMDATNATMTPDQVRQVIEQFLEQQFVYKEASHIVLIACYVPLFLVALFANCLVIFVVFKYHYMRSVTNYFLVNLSFADLLVTLICMPMAVGTNVSKLWIYGEVMCMLTTYFQGVSVSASVFTITAMSIDRYLAIRHPMAFRKVFNRKSTIFVIVALWVVSTLLFAPLLWVQQTQPVYLPGLEEAVETYGLKFCMENWSKQDFSKKVYGACLFTMVYAIPGTVVVAAYSLMGRRLCAVKPPFDENSTAGSASSQQGSRLVRERRRVARILLVLAILFAMCWLPYNVIMLVLDLLDSSDNVQWLIDMLPFTLLLGHCNSAINPLLYCFMTRNFRRTVRGLFTRRRPRPLGNRPQQRCKIRACPRTASATSSSGYDSYHSPHRRCYVLRLHTLRDSRGDHHEGHGAQWGPQWGGPSPGPSSSTRLTRLVRTPSGPSAAPTRSSLSLEQRYL
ncbi:orexin/Hypocretin receptor type 1-like isoform X2 [Frankliniella occidentalis]|uniref:Orexin/Hypocretin receptor type 1-like isoform X2 n=1 Tax=Frankliniella occidentalis TaxID=133901 RepID=A0A9C6U6G6_FRAOC|nr:orexin/Hypocretin receptor type 1-like isoform X2 [Frankliniella occidentalis]